MWINFSTVVPPTYKHIDLWQQQKSQEKSRWNMKSVDTAHVDLSTGHYFKQSCECTVLITQWSQWTWVLFLVETGSMTLFSTSVSVLVQTYQCLSHLCVHYSLPLSSPLNYEGHFASTDDFTTSFLHFSLFPAALWDLANSRPVHSRMLSSHLFLCPLSSSPFHCALQDGFDQTWWTGSMTLPLQFASFYDRQEIFMWSNCLLDLGTDFLVGNMVSVWDV